MSARDRLEAEDYRERFETLKSATEGLADRIERFTEGEYFDPQAVLEDVLFHLDQLAGRPWTRGVRLEDPR